MMHIQSFVCGAFEANAYLVYAPNRSDALLVDAGDDLDALLRAVQKSGRTLKAIVLTHGHFDHMLAAGRLREQMGAKIYIHALDAQYLCDPALNVYQAAVSKLPFEPCTADETIEQGALSLCGLDFQVLHTPGHTPGGICLKTEDVLFTGDTLFASGYGRMDLPGGNAGQMSKSLAVLMRLPANTRIYPGHGQSATIADVRGMFH